MVALMQRLIERGHAYADGSGSVYFDVASHPTYGSLTRQSLDDMQDAGEEMEEGKRDRRDFALWKAAKPSEPATAAWDTPFGRGRPRSEEHTSELQSRGHLVCRLLLEKKKNVEYLLQ